MLITEQLYRDLRQCAFRANRNAHFTEILGGSRFCRDHKAQWNLILPSRSPLLIQRLKESFELPLGAMAMIPPGNPYHILSQEDPGEYCRLGFDCLVLSPHVGNPLDRVLLPAIVPHPNPKEFKKLLEDLKKEMNTKGYASNWEWRMRLDGILHKLVIDFLLNGMKEGSISFLPSLATPWIGRVRKRLEQAFSDPTFRVPELALEFDVSEGHLYRTFKTCFGVTPVAWLQQYRISVAINLLSSQSRQSIDSLHERCGFKSRSQFYRVFKQETGSTPASYKGIRKEYGKSSS